MQAQFLIPMAVSIAYGIAFATILTLIVLPIFLSFSNYLKLNVKWLATGNAITKEEVERAVKEQKEEVAAEKLKIQYNREHLITEGNEEV